MAQIASAKRPETISLRFKEPVNSNKAISLKQANLADKTAKFR